jgi:integrase
MTPKTQDPAGRRTRGSWIPALGLPLHLVRKRAHTQRGDHAPAQAAAAPDLPPQATAGRDPAPIPEPLTAADWVETWLATKTRLRDSTRRSYQAHLRCHLRSRLSTVPLADLDAARLGQVFTGMLEAGISEATVRRVYCTLRSALNAAVRDGLIPGNPALYVQLPAGRRPHAVVWTRRRIRDWQRTGIRPPVAVWTTAQTRRFLKAIAGHRLYPAYQLIALNGLRRGEACGLRWADLDLDAGLAYITRQLQHVAGKLTELPPKTATSRRVVTLALATIAVLRAHYRAQQHDAQARGVTLSGYVFTTAYGGPLSPDHLTRCFGQLVCAAGVPPVRLHDLRHGAATQMLRAGTDLKTIADQLGHSSIVLTADTYLSVAIELGLKAAAATARLILGHGRRPPGGGRIRRRSAQPRVIITARAPRPAPVLVTVRSR